MLAPLASSTCRRPISVADALPKSVGRDGYSLDVYSRQAHVGTPLPHHRGSQTCPRGDLSRKKHGTVPSGNWLIGFLSHGKVPIRTASNTPLYARLPELALAHQSAHADASRSITISLYHCTQVPAGGAEEFSPPKA